MTLVLLDEAARPRIIERVPHGDARREHVLRDMIFAHPEMLPVKALDPSFGRLIAVTRELNIPGVGFIDVVLIDERGRLVVVECKLWRNPQARREVVGQILDYARELSRYSYDDLQRQVSISTKRGGNVLYDLARQAGSAIDEAQFVDRVTRDLAAGRFLLLIVGDGIAEGTRRIGEYLRDQPGLAFDFGLIEMAEYRFCDAQGAEQLIVQPRLLAQTAVIERHVIRSEVANLIVESVADRPATLAERPSRAERSSQALSESAQVWRQFVERFIAETRFDDPGQPPPRPGGSGWIKIPLPQGLYINAYRARGNEIGVQVRFPGSEGLIAYQAVAEECDAIDAEFASQNLGSPVWSVRDVPTMSLTESSPQPWDEAEEARQRQWLGRAVNQLVNSLRPRLQRQQD